MLKNKKHSKKFSRPIVIISILGVILGVSVMVVTLSVAVGFQNKIKGKLLSFGNHIQIESMFQSNNNETSPIKTLNNSFDELNYAKYIDKAQKYAYKSAIIQSKNKFNLENNEVEGVIFKGLESLQKNSFLKKYIIMGKAPKISSEINDTIILSLEKCQKLNLQLNNKIAAFFISNGKPKQRNLVVGGIYETGLSKIDSRFAFIDLKYLQKINNWGTKLNPSYFFSKDSSIINFSVNNKNIYCDWGNNEITDENSIKISTEIDTQITLIGYELNNALEKKLITIPDTLIISFTKNKKTITYENIPGSGQYYSGGIEIFLKNIDERHLIKDDLKLKFGPEYKITTIDEQHEEIFSWLNLIYKNVYIILGLMIAVAIINMSCALLVLIVEKTKMIGILKALGIKNSSLIKIFATHGGLLLSFGFIGGNILAIIIIKVQNKFEFLKLSQENYYLDTVPMEYPILSILVLNIFTFLFCFLAMMLPSLISSRISPIKAINSDI